jgi:hypothetical protein
MTSNVPMTDYSLRIAQRHVELYSSQDKGLMAQHRQAMECRACEQFLNTGIEAYKWVKHADDVLREAARQGFEVKDECVEVLNLLYRQWLVPCRHAMKWVETQQANGFVIGNLEEFEAAKQDVRKQVQRQKDYATLDDTMQGKPFDTGFWEEAARLPTEQA